MLQKKVSRRKQLIKRFLNSHEDESFADETEIANELSAFLILHNMENITDDDFISIIKELKHIYFGQDNHY